MPLVFALSKALTTPAPCRSNRARTSQPISSCEGAEGCDASDLKSYEQGKIIVKTSVTCIERQRRRPCRVEGGLNRRQILSQRYGQSLGHGRGKELCQLGLGREALDGVPKRMGLRSGQGKGGARVETGRRCAYHKAIPIRDRE